jgi:hypothetical protein
MNFQKYKAAQLGHLFDHNNRTAGDGCKRANEGIDDERTSLNYHFKKGTTADVGQRVSELFSIRKDFAVVMGEFVISLPHDVKPEDERKFFSGVYEFFCNDFEEKNIINAVVHKDEERPHMHLDFVPAVKGAFPVVDEERKNSDYRYLLQEKWKAEHGLTDETMERLCCKDLINREYLANLHPRMSVYIEEVLGYECEILNGATENGNKTVMQLKNERLAEEITRLKKEKAALTADVDFIKDFLYKNNLTPDSLDLISLMSELNFHKKQNELLKNVISKKGYAFTKEEISSLRSIPMVKSKASKVSVLSSTIAATKIPDQSIIVLEIWKNVQRELPQKKYFDQNEEVQFLMHRAMNVSGDVVWLRSRERNITYVFFKADNKNETINNLIALQENIVKKKGEVSDKVIIMERLTYDEYDFGRLVLEKLPERSFYLVGTDRDTPQRSAVLEKDI